MIKYPYLNDHVFLKQIDALHNRTYYANLIILTKEEMPLTNIEGLVIDGSISLNGNSAIRRSGSINLIATDATYNLTDLANLIAINKRVIVEIGIENIFTQYTDYPILWFPFGTFVISNANISKSTSGIRISVNIKDKMALLNGECGGTIYTAITHSPMYIEQADGKYGQEKVLFRTLITELVHKWGNIPTHKIIIEDLEDILKNTVAWGGSKPLYIKDSLVSTDILPGASNIVQYHENAGYILTDFVYPDELTSAVGESVMQVLDKIKKMLGNFEYFFDIEGNFRFRKIRNYLNEGSAFDNLEEAFGDAYLVGKSEGEKVTFSFRDTDLVASYSNQPKYEAIKNDYVAWGVKGDNKVAIRYHLIIDNTPEFIHATYSAYCYTDEFGVFRAVPQGKTMDNQILTDIEINDWRVWLYYDYVVNGNYNDYGEELKQEFPRIYDLKTGEYFAMQGDDAQQRSVLNSMVYWIDILDPAQIVGNELAKKALSNMTVSAIGRRTKTIKDDKINCLFNIMPPDLIFIEAGKGADTTTARQAAQRYIASHGLTTAWTQVKEEIYKQFNIGTLINPAYDAIRSVLHETTAYNETISLSTIPVLHLEPNMRIEVEDAETNISGDYMINSLTIPLGYNGMMTINASRAIERI